ncbi:MAG: sulfatase [Planctomycetota bacterium]|nr:sulfatase [Planctomycetota bacterium]MDA1179565.1 sulfatase [Planctomycetota bacterium]
MAAPQQVVFSRLFTFLFVCGCCASGTTQAARPNVLLLLVDDLKPSFHAYGDAWVHSPHLDRLASRGMRFDRAYCNQAVCAPSRNNLLLGSRSTSIGVYSLGTNFRKAVPDAITMPQYFKLHGYHTAGIGKVFHVGHGNVNDAASWSEPFHPDKVIDYALPESTRGRMTREEARFANLPSEGLPRGPAFERANVPNEAYADGRIATEAIRRLQRFKTTDDLKHGIQPFFLAVGFTKPHLPFCAPQWCWDQYDRAKFPLAAVRVLPEGAPNCAGKSLGELGQYEPVPTEGPLSEELERTLVHGYYAALSYMDAQVGRVLDELERLRLLENTIIILWGDHGFHLGDHGLWTKHTNYEQANRIPLVIVAPGVTSSGSSSNVVVETVDVFPTLCELAGLEAPVVPQPIDGESLMATLQNHGDVDSSYAYHCFPRERGLMGRAIRTSRYRLVEWRDTEPRAAEAISEPVYELYDYDEDPLEIRNHADERPQEVERLARILALHPVPKPPIP